MATAARKARKRSGIPFAKKAKVATPIFERSIFTAYWSEKALAFVETAKARRFRKELSKLGIEE